MTNKTITFKCPDCGQELTFYKHCSDGASCPVCDALGYKPPITQYAINIKGIDEIKATRELYKKQSKNSPKVTLEDVLNS